MKKLFLILFAATYGMLRADDVSAWYTAAECSWSGGSSGEFTVFGYEKDPNTGEMTLDPDITGTMTVRIDGTVDGWDDFINKKVENPDNPGTFIDYFSADHKIMLNAAKNAAVANVKIENMAENLAANAIVHIENTGGGISWYHGAYNSITKSIVPDRSETATIGTYSAPAYIVKLNDKTGEYELCVSNQAVSGSASWSSGSTNNIPSWVTNTLIVATNDIEELKTSITYIPICSEDGSNIWGRTLTYSGSGSFTNIYADFSAPTNWVDGTTIFVTNGVYSMDLSYQNLTNYTWVTNWTEAVRTITKNETTNIVNVVTNLVNRYQNITTQVYKVEAFTNWYEMVDWTTNYTVHVTTNVQEILDFTTNIVTLTKNITNKQEFVSFQTNMFYNNIFITNFMQQSVGFTNWHNVYYVTTNTIVRTTNYFSNISRVLQLPQPLDPDDPNYDPEEDPASSEYKPENDTAWTNSIFYKYHQVTNTLFNITNNFNEVATLENTYDNKSVWINGPMWSNDPALTNGQVEIKGYAYAGYYYLGTNETVRYIPKKVAMYHFDEGFPVMYTNYLEWAEEDETSNTNNAALDILTNDIEVVRKFIQKYGDNITINLLVTNAERFAEMRTNFFAQVNVDALLDNASVWTNGEKKIEVKGFDKAEANTFFVKSDSGLNEGRWETMYTVDSNAEATGDGVSAPDGYNSIELVNSNDYTVGSFPFASPTNHILSVWGFLDAAKGTMPVKLRVDKPFSYSEELSWKQYYFPDFASITTNAMTGTESGAQLELYGFANAQAGKVPKKTADGKLEWGDAGGVIEIVGTDGVMKYATNKVEFVSASDCSVEVKATDDNAVPGKVKLTIGVYYK